MVRSEVNLNKNVVSIAQFSTPASTPAPPHSENCSFCMFSLSIFHPFFHGGSADSICHYVRTPVDRTAAEQLLSPKLLSSADADRNVMCFTAILVDASSRSYEVVKNAYPAV